jgi:hypothetical protein
MLSPTLVPTRLLTDAKIDEAKSVDLGLSAPPCELRAKPSNSSLNPAILFFFQEGFLRTAFFFAKGFSGVPFFLSYIFFNRGKIFFLLAMV